MKPRFPLGVLTGLLLAAMPVTAVNINIFNAAAFGDVEAAKSYISSGGDVNAQNDDGWTPLMLAVNADEAEMVQLLLAAKADVNIKNHQGETSVSRDIEGSGASAHGVYAVGAKEGDIRIFDNGSTALMIAATKGLAHMVKLLIAAKADVNVVSDVGNTALMAAIDSWEYEKGKLELVRQLVRAQTDLNVANQEYLTALMLALRRVGEDATTIEEDQPIADLLIKSGARLEYKDDDGWTALFFASYNGKPEAVHHLVLANVNIETKDKDGWTPLMYAAMEGHANVVDILIRAKANVNAKNSDGWTALMIAADNGYADVAKLLIGAKANINAKDPYLQTAIIAAGEAGHDDLIALLKNAGASIGVYEAAAIGDTNFIASYIKRGGDVVDTINNNGWTVLMEAAKAGRADVATLVIGANAKVNGTDNDGNTPLMIAANHGHADIAKLLIDAKANVNATRKNGETALMIAADNGYADVAKLLIDAKADVKATDKDGKTALTYATERFDKLPNDADPKPWNDLIELLRSADATP